MPLRYDTEEEVKSRRSSASRSREDNDTEIALGTRSLLAIFFGLVLVCGVFFGLGYSIGRAGGSREAAQASPGLASAVPNQHLSKPSADQTLTPVQAPTEAPETETATTDSPATTTTPASTTSSQPSTVVVAQNPAPGGVPGAKTATLQPAAATVPGPGSVMVQVAAVRVQQDAQILVEALKKHGYSAVVRNEPQDQLLHIQLGPFNTRSDAMAMRAKLLSDGYNAVVK